MRPKRKYAVARRADLLPERRGLLVGRDFVVALEDGEPEAARVEAVLVDEQVPGEADGVLLEVVAEGEVAEHLEEGVMARGLADLVEVVVLAARAQALLRRDGARVVALLRAEEHVLELVHPGVGEQQRRVVGGQQRARSDAAVAVSLEITQELLADFVSSHHKTSAFSYSAFSHQQKEPPDSVMHC